MNKKVYILTILVFVMAINAVFSQTTTKKLSYQAVVRNAANELVVNQNLSVEITILNANNVPQYKETHPSVPTNQNGLLWLWVGEGNPTLGTMEDVVWKDATIRSVFTLPDGSTVTQNTPVTAMPHAYFADEVDTIFLQDYLTTHNYGNEDYVTHQELNDTLNHYYTNEQVDAALIPYATNAHLNDTLSHYLMKEVQVLSISHDTIFLTGGSFVVLPKGFSGSYHDLVDTPTNVSAFTNDAGYLTEHQSLEGYVTNDKLKDTLNAYYDTTHIKQTLKQYLKSSELCDSIVKCEVVKNMRDSLHNAFDTLKYYTTSDQIDTLLGAYYDSAKVKSVISDTATALRAMMGDAAYNAKITLKKNNVELDSFRLNQQTDKAINIPIPTTVAELSDADNYVTKTKLNDTLGAYYDTANVKQMLKPYLKANELCDSIVKCDVIKDMRDSLGNAFDTLKYYTTSNQIDTLLDAYATTEDLALYELQENLCKDVKTCIKDTLGKYTTTNQIDTLLGAYYDTTHTKSVISDTATALRAMMGDAAYNAKITLKKNNVELDSFRLNQQTDKAINIPVPTTVAELSDAGNYVTKEKLNDTLGAYYDTANVKQMLKPYLKANELCDSIVKCDVIKDMRDSLDNAFDTLKHYTTSNQIDTLLDAYATTEDLAYYERQEDLCKDVKTCIKDTLAAYYDTADVNQMLKPYLKANELCDSIVKCDVIKDMRDSIRNNAAAIQTNANNISRNEQAIIDSSANIRKEIKYGQITIALNRGSETGVTNPTFGVNQADTQIVTINIPEATTVNNGQLTIVAAGDTTRFTANQATNDTVRLDKFATKEALKDTAKTLRGIICDSATACITKALANPTSEINYAIDTIARHNISDSTRMVFDTLHKYYATKDTLKNFVNKLAIRDSVNKIVKDSLRIGTSAINQAIDTIARHNISDSTRMVFDTLHKYYATKDTLKNFVNKLAIRDSVNNIVKDSLAAPNSAINIAIDTIARHNISDSTRMVFDTLHKYYATKDTLKNFVNKLAIRDSVNKIVTDSLRKGPSEMTRAIDSIARHHISDSTRMVFDTLHLYYTTLQTLKDTASNIRSAFPTVNNGTLTIQKNGTSVGSFTANQSTPENINIDVPTKLSQMINDGGVYAKRDSINVFTAENNFTSTVTVPSNTTTIPRPTTAEHPCTDNTANAVNICDLLAVFDSLNSRIKKLEDNMALMKSAMRPTEPKLSLVDRTTHSIQVSANATNSVYDIKKYKFCCTNCGTGGTQLCSPLKNTDGYIFDNLEPLTSYSFTVETFTLFDTVESPLLEFKTKALAPTADVHLTPMPTGIAVLLDNVDLKGMGAGSVLISYKLSGSEADYSNPVPYMVTPNGGPISEDILDLVPNTNYDVRIELSNGDGETTYINTATTGGALSLSISRILPADEGNVRRCKIKNKNKFENYLLFKAEINDNYDDYNYEWTISNVFADESSTEEIINTNGDSCLVYFIYTDVENEDTQMYSITCKATHKRHANLAKEDMKKWSFCRSDRNGNNNNGDGFVPNNSFPSPSITVNGYEITVTGNNISQISWYNNAILESVTIPAVHNYEGFSGEHTIATYSQYGCRKDESKEVASLLDITSDPASGNITICKGAQGTVTYTATPVAEQGAVSDYNYEWMVNGNTIPNNGSNIFEYTYNATNSTYTVRCQATHKTIDKVISNIKKTTVTKLTSVPSFSTCVNGLEVTLKNTSNISSLNWGGAGTGSNTNYIYESDGNYSITATSNNGCTYTDEVTVSATSSQLTPCTGTIHQDDTYKHGYVYNADSTAWDGYEHGTTGAITHVTDYDGNVYRVVQIGSQCWMAENMRCTHSPKGYGNIVNPQGVAPNSTNVTLTRCWEVAHWWNNDSANYYQNGLLYNWCAAADQYYSAEGYAPTGPGTSGCDGNDHAIVPGADCASSGSFAPSLPNEHRGICPKGWHLPTKAEFNLLKNNYTAAALKIACVWGDGTNSSGFSAMPVGYFHDVVGEAPMTGLGNSTRFWSATLLSTGQDEKWHFNIGDDGFSLNTQGGPQDGASVRCVRNAE